MVEQRGPDGNARWHAHTWRKGEMGEAMFGCHMCGLFSLKSNEEFYERFAITNRLDTLVARDNIDLVVWRSPAASIP